MIVKGAGLLCIYLYSSAARLSTEISLSPELLLVTLSLNEAPEGNLGVRFSMALRAKLLVGREGCFTPR